MKFLIFNIIVILFSITLYSCNEDSVVNNQLYENGNFTYPYEINTAWYYGTRNFAYNFRPDSIKNIYGSDTLSGYGEAIFLRDTVVGIDTCRILRNAHSETGHAHATYELYKQTDTGLIRIAHYSNGTNFGPYRTDCRYKFSFNGKSYNSSREIFSEYKNDLKSTTDIQQGDTVLIMDDPPVNTLKYPILKGMEWVIITDETGGKITKKYSDYENINLLGSNYYCIKIQKQWYFNFQTPVSELIYFDYFSKEGMVKRDFTIKDIEVSNELGQTIGYFDAKEESFLNIYFQP
ncbi:MAG TPA: hypothetical protein PKD83_08150 [Ignavibacteria bacterium]|nr:hypothetical protein [Ignavibacteria bacterium]